MLSFLLLLFPISLIVYCLAVKDRNKVPMICIGVVTGVLVSACKLFFTYTHRIIPDSFAENYVYYLLNQSLISLIVLFVVFCLISKDTWEYKIKYFFPLETAYFAIYLPFCVITQSEFYYQGYDILLKPAVYLAMLLQISFSLWYFYKGIVNKKPLFVILNFMLAAGYLVYPAVSDSLYAINYKFSLIVLFDVIFILLPVVHTVAVFIKNYILTASE